MDYFYKDICDVYKYNKKSRAHVQYDILHKKTNRSDFKQEQKCENDVKQGLRRFLANAITIVT